MSSSIYKNLLTQYTDQANRLAKRLNFFSFSRLVLFILFIYLAYRSTQTGAAITILSTILVLAIFFIVVRLYDQLQQKTIYCKALAKYNEDEINFLATNKSAYPNGKEYEDPHHPYSYDLDLFGAGGLYGYLNRCSTQFGKKELAASMLYPDVTAIKSRQEAIAELAANPHFRQKIFAYGNIQEAKEKDVRQLLNWVHEKKSFVRRPLYMVLMVFPLATMSAIIYYLLNGSDTAFRIAYILFFINLGIAFAFGKKITSQLSVSSSVTKILLSYKNQLRLIEQEKFESSLLQEYQQLLKKEKLHASRLLHQLASLFEHLESVVNLVVSVLLNGLFLFHIHILYRLGIWEKQHAKKITGWLEVIGHFEALNSLANFSYNNPDNCFPQTMSLPGLQATSLGHPLIATKKRICNDVSFQQQKFVILTGSNMSGKSTFLRTVGMNLVLARSGSAVTATTFTFFPFDVYVSMRITDSLQESESFFYAELKRLQTIINYIEEGHNTFVILDEILRGTNSNDKRNGTIGLIHKLAGFNTFGIIATHDVVVAELIKEYPDFIANKAFESEIINDELLFDYTLKDGVCTKLSASYLMKKLGVID